MAVTIGAYIFPDPLDGLDTGTYSFYDDHSAEMVFIIPWSDIALAATGSLGATHPYAGGGLIVRDFSWEPLGDKTAVTFDNARVTLTFGPDEEPEDEDLGEINISMTAETISLPKKNFKKDTGGTPVPFDEEKDPTPFKLIPNDDLQIKLNRVAVPKWAKISEHRGKINDAAFDIGPVTYAKNEVLFLGADTRKTFNLNGDNHWEVTYHFAVRPLGGNWNKIWIPDPGGWENVTPKLYEEATFTELF